MRAFGGSAERVRRAGVVACVLAASGAGAAAAQSAAAGEMELPPLLPREREVALARSAAPGAVTADATVLVLERGVGYVEAVAGTNGVTCIVDRTWARSVEPQCFDREASETILPLRLRFAALREARRSRAEVDADREAGIRDGRYRLPRRPALTWMMSAGQVLYDDEGSHVGAWRPHIMIYFPAMTATELGLAGEPYEHGPWLSDDGEPTATLVVPMPEFVPVEGGPSAGAGGGSGR